MNTSSLFPSAWRAALVPVVDYDFRTAYRDESAKMTARDRAVVADVCDLVAHWNRTLTRPGKGGKNKIRILDLTRFRLIRDCLQAFDADQIAAAIVRYAGTEWNLKTGNWKRPDNFFRAHYIRDLLEAIEADAEKAAAARPPADPRVRDLVAAAAGRMAPADPDAAVKARFTALAEAEKQALRSQAIKELVEMGRTARRITAFEADRQAMVIMKRDRESTERSR
ncbi:MAG: hypothetical protein GX591_11970 [Planctomycetes bacterium]|nr:hypothetical protein [Planctomycetota bacterium]